MQRSLMEPTSGKDYSWEQKETLEFSEPLQKGIKLSFIYTFKVEILHLYFQSGNFYLDW